jgi:hypothetical protein
MKKLNVFTRQIRRQKSHNPGSPRLSRNLKPIRSATPYLLTTTYVECNCCIQALRALGEKINNYGRIPVPKILQAFPDDICRSWIIHVKRERLSEGDIKLMAFLNEEVEGSLITQKIRGDVTGIDPSVPKTAAFHVHTKSTKPNTLKPRGRQEPFRVFCCYAAPILHIYK